MPCHLKSFVYCRSHTSSAQNLRSVNFKAVCLIINTVADETDEDEDEDEDEDGEDLMMDLTPEEAAALEQYQRSRSGPSKIKFGKDEV